MTSIRQWSRSVAIFAAVTASVLVPSQQALAGPPANAPILVEQMVRHSHALIAQVNLLSGAGFSTTPQFRMVLDRIIRSNPYLIGLANAKLTVIPPRPPYRMRPERVDPEYGIRWRVSDFEQSSSLFYQELAQYSWAIATARMTGDLRLAFHADAVNSAKLNYVVQAFSVLLPAVPLYIEALRETYLVAPVLDCPNRDLLINLLAQTEAIYFELRRLMDNLFCNPYFAPAFPAGWGMIESTFHAYRIDVDARVTYGIPPFPYHIDGGEYYVPTGITPVPRPVGRPVLRYDETRWQSFPNTYVDANPIDPKAGPVPGVATGAPGGVGPMPLPGGAGAGLPAGGAAGGGETYGPPAPGGNPGAYGAGVPAAGGNPGYGNPGGAYGAGNPGAYGAGNPGAYGAGGVNPGTGGVPSRGVPADNGSGRSSSGTIGWADVPENTTTNNGNQNYNGVPNNNGVPLNNGIPNGR